MSANTISYGNGLPSDYNGILCPRDTFVRPVEQPLYEQVGQPGGEINTPVLFASTMAISSIQGEFISNLVSMDTVNLTISSIVGTSNATLSTIGNVVDALQSTSLCAFKNQGLTIAGNAWQGGIYFGQAQLNTQFSNTVYTTQITWPPSKADPVAPNNAICFTTLRSDQAEVSTPLTTVQFSNQPYAGFNVYGQANSKFNYLVVHLDQTVV